MMMILITCQMTPQRLNNPNCQKDAAKSEYIHRSIKK